MSTNKMYYLAGPMTGIDKFNYPLFFQVAASLRELGYMVINPAEQDTPDVMRAVYASDGSPGTTPGFTWGDALAHDVKLVADHVDALAVLPGWEESKGACTEVWLATICDKPVYEILRRDPPRYRWWPALDPIPVSTIAAKLMAKLLKA